MTPDVTRAERAASCQWRPGERARWQAIGHVDGLRAYGPDTQSGIAWGLWHYTGRGRLTYGAYEQGIATACADLLGVPHPQWCWDRACELADPAQLAIAATIDQAA